MLRVVYESFLEAIIRFWNNRFQSDDQVRYLRMENDKLRQANDKLISQLIELSKPVTVDEPAQDTRDLQPLRGQYRSWEQRRRELEATSLRKAIELSDEAKLASARSQTTEQLEADLGINHAVQQ